LSGIWQPDPGPSLLFAKDTRIVPSTLNEFLPFVSGSVFNIVAALVVLTIVVFVHEMGHFLVARWNRVRVDVFSIGFGPELIGITDRHGTRWKFSAIPLGGYVKFFGDENEASTGADDREMTEEEKAVSFHHKPVWRRAAVVVAGPAANCVFAIALYAGIFMVVGMAITPPIISDVLPGSAAEEAGLQPGDRVVAIDGEEVSRFEQVQHRIPLANGASVRLIVERDGQRVEVTATPRVQDVTDELGETRQMAVLGIAASTQGQENVRLGPVAAVGEAFAHSYFLVEATFVAVGQIVAGERGTEDLGGPLRIAEMSGQMAELGLTTLLLFMAFLSVNLGLINILPIPVLDGGHLVFYALEAIRGRPVNDRAQEYSFRIGLALILSLMVFVTWNDIVNLIDRHLTG
jgi:regulator of sigma E protease